MKQCNKCQVFKLKEDFPMTSKGIYRHLCHGCYTDFLDYRNCHNYERLERLKKQNCMREMECV